MDDAVIQARALGPKADPALSRAGKEASGCHRCPLHEPATQTVFGEGPADAAVMFVGEQPGDQEDTIGRPFVGPAGQMMDRAMEEAGIDRRIVYVTNAVKHFKFNRGDDGAFTRLQRCRRSRRAGSGWMWSGCMSAPRCWC